MHVFPGSVAAVAVAVIYCIWKVYALRQLRQRRSLHERVAYMLWVAANQSR